MKIILSSTSAPAAVGPYSQGVLGRELVFLSGQLGIDPATQEMASGVRAQADQALKNVEAVLATRGLSLEDVVKTTVYLADIADFAAVNEVYAAHFAEPFPARSAFQVGALPLGGLVEVEVIAERP